MSDKLIGTKPNQVPSNSDLGSMAYLDYEQYAPAFLGSGRRNLLINGDFKIWQRGTSFTGVVNAYTADRWTTFRSSAGTANVSQVELSNAEKQLCGHKYAMQIQDTASTNNGRRFDQRIEDDITKYEGKSMTVSFWAKCDATDPDKRRFNYIILEGNGDADNLYSHIELTNDLRYYTVTFNNVQTNGTSTNKQFMVLGFRIDNSNTSTFTITGVQLEEGKIATPYEHRSIGEELALCQRYYQKLMVYELNASGENDHVGGTIPLLVEMRADPVTQRYDLADTAGKVSYTNTGNVGGPTHGGTIDGIASSYSTLNKVTSLYWWRYVASNNTYGFVTFKVTADAEL